jgi:beta-xylosidase
MAPIHWDAEGWPSVEFTAPNTWGSSYRYPLPNHEVTPLRRTTTFPGPELEHQFEWNHNPDTTKFTVQNGLTLRAATVTDDFFQARNTLSHRIVGPTSAAIVELDISGMLDGDKAGLAVFRFDVGWIGISKVGDTTTLEMVDSALMDPTDGWHTVNKGEVIASLELTFNTVWLKVDSEADGSPTSGNFSYSTDGINYTTLGKANYTANDKLFFMGDRWGIFNFATKSLGGEVVAKSFTIQ